MNRLYRRPAPNCYRLSRGVRITSGETGGLAICNYPLRVVHLGATAARLLQFCQEQQSPELLAASLHLPVKHVQALCEQLCWKGLLEAGPAPPLRTWPGVSIIVPSYNRAEQLERCLRSLSELDYPASCLEVIVVDDASTDGTSKMLQCLGQEYEASGRVLGVVRHASQQGVARGRNTGAQAAQYALLAYIDSDCVASAEWLKELVPAFESPQVSAVGGMIRAYERRSLLGRYEDVRSSLFMGVRAQRVSLEGPLKYVPTANLIVRREMWQRLAGFAPLTYGEDVDFCRRLLAMQGQVLYLPQGVVYHDYRTRWWAFLSIRASYASAEAALLKRHPEERRLLILPPEQAAFAGLAVGGLWLSLVALLRRRRDRGMWKWGDVGLVPVQVGMRLVALLGKCRDRGMWSRGGGGLVPVRLGTKPIDVRPSGYTGHPEAERLVAQQATGDGAPSPNKPTSERPFGYTGRPGVGGLIAQWPTRATQASPPHNPATPAPTNDDVRSPNKPTSERWGREGPCGQYISNKRNTVQSVRRDRGTQGWGCGGLVPVLVGVRTGPRGQAPGPHIRPHILPLSLRTPHISQVSLKCIGPCGRPSDPIQTHRLSIFEWYWAITRVALTFRWANRSGTSRFSDARATARVAPTFRWCFAYLFLFALILTFLGAARRWNKVRRQRLPVGPLAVFKATLRGHLAYTYHLCRHLTRYYTLPLLIVGLVLPPLLVLALLLIGIVLAVDYMRLRPEMSLGAYALCAVLEDCAYEVGVVRGCIIHRTWKPLWPIISKK